MNTERIVIIAHNIRSTHNVGAVFRTAEGFGVETIYIGGYTPYPAKLNDGRLPHIRQKITKQISKTALGTEQLVAFETYDELAILLQDLEQAGFVIAGLEQDSKSVTLPNFAINHPTALIIGEEVAGLTDEIRNACDVLLEIPMQGQKESFNVSVATGIALYALRTNKQQIAT